jgi:hypothetical protein
MKLLTSFAAMLALCVSVNAADDTKKPDAAAGAKPKADPAVAFGKLDKDSSKSLSKEEFLASPAAKKDAAKAEAAFGKKDKDANGSLSLEEFSAAGGKKKQQ